MAPAGDLSVPTFLNKVIKVMNDEMLLVLSLGLCFGMVLIANALGFSSELGAFLAGSLLAGTVHVERVEHITKGVKDLFVTFFFLSVGMKVDPNAIVSYAPIIIIITVVAVIAKLVFATIGMLLSGQTMSTAVKSGFSLAPIGEFSFIIASLGVSLSVMEANLYPIIVTAAVLTTFLTPFLIKNSSGVTAWLERRLPEGLLYKLNQYTSEDQVDDDEDNEWTNIYGNSVRARGFTRSSCWLPSWPVCGYCARFWRGRCRTCFVKSSCAPLFTSLWRFLSNR